MGVIGSKLSPSLFSVSDFRNQYPIHLNPAFPIFKMHHPLISPSFDAKIIEASGGFSIAELVCSQTIECRSLTETTVWQPCHRVFTENHYKQMVDGLISESEATKRFLRKSKITLRTTSDTQN